MTTRSVREARVRYDECIRDGMHSPTPVLDEAWEALVDAIEAAAAGEDQDEPDLAVTAASVADGIRAKGGAVGTITGPPIIGTTDTVNAGPAKPGG